MTRARGSVIQPAASNRELYDLMVEEALRLGLDKPIMISGGKAPKLIFEIHGEERFISIPRKGGDRHTQKNCVALLRRMVRQMEAA